MLLAANYKGKIMKAFNTLDDDDELNELLLCSMEPVKARRRGYPADPNDASYYEEVDNKLGKACMDGYKQWTTSDGNVFLPASTTRETLTPGVYDIKTSERIGLFFEKVPVRTEGRIEFPHTTSFEVINEIEKFWGLEKTFSDFGMAYKRGILLYGMAGGAKVPQYK